MTLKIKRIREKHGTRICLSGELRCSHLIDVRAEIEQVGQPATLDLDSVDVIDIDGVRLLNDCQALGIQVMNYSPYIREWMLQEKANPSRREIAIPFLSPGWMPELYQSLLKEQFGALATLPDLLESCCLPSPIGAKMSSHTPEPSEETHWESVHRCSKCGYERNLAQ